uniref:Non-specific serine/threonine protein kinase n=1 Tax=Percolomonas cosmopolitus TaxID=63605 RepID=A0A7S1KN85_9EUKA
MSHHHHHHHHHRRHLFTSSGNATTWSTSPQASPRKILLLGPPLSGKSAFATRILHNSFLKHPEKTPHSLELVHVGEYHGGSGSSSGSIKLAFIESGQLWRNVLMRCVSDRSIRGILIIFDVTADPSQTFNLIFNEYLRGIQEAFGDAEDDRMVALVGTKIDLITKRQISRDMLQDALKTQSCDLPYYEMSSGDGSYAFRTMEAILCDMNLREMRGEHARNQSEIQQESPFMIERKRALSAISSSLKSHVESSASPRSAKSQHATPVSPSGTKDNHHHEEHTYHLRLLRKADEQEMELDFQHETAADSMFERCVHAIQRNDLHTLREILLDVLDLELVQNAKGRTLVHYAALLNRTRMVKFLVSETKTRIDKADHLGYTPLLLACRRSHLDIARILLQFHSLVNVCENENRYTSLHFAVFNRHPRLVSLLVQHSADVEARNVLGETPVHLAAVTNCDVLRPLLKKHPNLELRDGEGFTPLMVASAYGRKSIVDLLLSFKALPFNLDSSTNSPLAMNKALFHQFTQKHSHEQASYTPLHAACHHGHLEVVQLLVEKGSAPVNYVEPLRGFTPLFLAAEKGNEQIVRYLVHFGADLSFRTSDKKTVLHYATLSGNLGLVQFVVREKPVLARMRDSDGYSPLMLSCFSPSHVEICRFFVRMRGEDAPQIDAQTALGKTALHLGTLRGTTDTVSLLLESGANSFIEDNQNAKPIDLTLNTTLRNLVLRYMLMDPNRTRAEKRSVYFSNALPARVADSLHDEGLSPRRICHEICSQLVSRKPLRDTPNLENIRTLCDALKHDFSRESNKKEYSEYCSAMDALFDGKRIQMEERQIIDKSAPLSGFYHQMELKLFELFLRVSSLSFRETTGNSQTLSSHSSPGFSEAPLHVEAIRVGQLKVRQLHAGSDFVANCDSLLRQHTCHPLDPIDAKTAFDFHLSPFAERIFKLQILSEIVAPKICIMYEF